MYIYFINIILIASFHYYFSKKNYSYEALIWNFYIIFLMIFVGLRHKVGGDWGIYNKFFEEHKFYDLEHVRLSGDFVYIYINKIANLVGAGIYGVNLFSAIIFFLAINSFLKNTKNKWLGLLICFPIVIVVLGMGYARQGLAFAFALFLILSLENRKIIASLIYFALALFSHKSSLCCMLFYIFYILYYKNYKFLILCFIGSILIYFLFQASFNHLFFFYLGSGQHMMSWGSIPRTLLLSLVSIIFLYSINDLKLSDYQKFFYKYLSYIILLISPFSFLTSVTTDRILLYYCMIKIIFVSFADLENRSLKLLANGIILLYITYFSIWMIFGVNSIRWLPYSFLGL